jgi:hypothetical protein
MIFDHIYGITTSYSSRTITDNTKILTVDYYRGWTAILPSEEVEIISNTIDTMTSNGDNTLSENVTYEVALLTRAVLAKTDKRLLSTVMYPDSVLNPKIRQTYVDFEQKVYSKFKNLLTQFTDGELPQDYIYNLFRLKQSMVYHCLALVFLEDSIMDDDFKFTLSVQYRSKSKEAFNDSIGLVTVDLDKSGAYSNAELSKNMSRNMYLGR